MVYEDGEGCYWVVSLPVLGGSAEATWDAVQENTVYSQDLSNNFKLNVPDTLRVGTLDSLMEMSDELVRDTQAIEATCAKLRRQCLEHSTASGTGSSRDRNDQDNGLALDLKNEDAEALESFSWDEAKYPSNRPLKEARERVMEGVHRCDDALKVKVSEFGSVRANLSALTRRSQGSLAVREIGTIVKEDDYVMTENLNTVMIVVPVHSKKDFIKTYEKWSNFSFITNEGRSAHISSAVPRSAKVVAEDKDYLLVRVIVFAKMVEAFKGSAREKGYQVRDFTFDADQQEEEEESLQSLKVQAKEMEQQMVEWCVTAYKEILSSWMHMLTIRIFVESILRYGLPPKFQAAVIKPNKKCDVKVRAVLANHFGKHMSNHWKRDAEDNNKGAPGGSTEDIFPYVSFTVNFNK
jgi:V-type H+-transporting ATPase subunit C